MTLANQKCSPILLVAAFVFCAAFAHAQFRATDGPAQPAKGTSTDFVIVTFQDAPAATYTGDIAGYPATKPARGKKLNVNDNAVQNYLRRLSQGHANFRSFLNNSAPKAQVVNEYFLVQNAVAVQLNGHSASALASGPGVKSVDASWVYKPSMNVSTGLIKASQLWTAPGVGGRSNAGAGVKVGVIDSGVDTNHPFLQCHSGTITHKQYASGKVGFNPNRIITGTHGTHVAGTIAGCVTNLTSGPVLGEISGIAPAAELHDYNVFPGFGVGHVFQDDSAFSHDILEAVEDAVADGMDVINLSLGGGVNGPHDLLADGINAAVEAGVVAAVAAGNSGPGAFTVESPGSAINALTAGAITNPHFVGVPVTSGTKQFGAVVGEFGALNNEITGSYSTTSPADGCTAISTQLTGKIAVINRGTCTFQTKVDNAEAAGAVAVIIVNNIIGDPITMAGDSQGAPAVMVSKESGVALGASGTVTIGATLKEFITNNADIIASFSSRGPTPFTYLLKPDVTAPGVNVYSSVFDESTFQYGFEMFQGTSMATPHLTGTAVLLRQLHPTWSAFDIKSAIVNTAVSTVLNASADGTPKPGVLTRGTGRVDATKANAAPVSVTPVSASFGLFNGNVPVTGSVALTLSALNGATTCSVSTGSTLVTPSAKSVTVTDTANLTFALNGGQSSTLKTGTYTGEAKLTCNGTTLNVPWLVVVNREAKP